MTLTFELLPLTYAQKGKGVRFWAMDEQAKRDFARGLLVQCRVKGLADGKLCCVCAAPNAEGHHDCYDRPFEVAWLCKRHHSARHIEIGASAPPRTQEDRAARPPSRQITWLRGLRAGGFCVRCGNKHVKAVTKAHCLEHALEQRERSRTRGKGKWTSNCLTERLLLAASVNNSDVSDESRLVAANGKSRK